MRLRLQVSEREGAEDYSERKLFRFAVVDLDKAKGYPLNFVCMLPMRISLDLRAPNVFTSVFGSESLDVAKGLLVDALKREDDPGVREEVKRRLKLLEPKGVGEIRCSGCGRLFRPRRVRRFQQNFCKECMRKKFGSRE